MKNKLVLITLFVALSFAIVYLISTNVASQAAQCWQHVANDTCSVDSNCQWRTDSWGSWCEELNCWSLSTESSCTSTAVPGKNCTWHSGQTNYYCSMLNCWSYSATNSNSCVNNSVGLSCQWQNQCYSIGGTSCWSYQNETDCLSAVGCSWGSCGEQGCWSYNDSDSCVASKDPWNKRNCTWTDTGSGSGYCTSAGCWNYYNRTTCTESGYCDWQSYGSSGWCQELSCSSFNGNQSGCLNTSSLINRDCKYENGFCTDDDCWSYDKDQTACNSKAGCVWSSWTSTGWCEEINCWLWDGSRNGNQTVCEENATAYGLNCAWQSTGSSTNDGLCFKDTSTTSCDNITTERSCMDTSYCWWEYTDWNNASGGGRCKNPEWGTGNATQSIVNEWNPGCYIFDRNQTECDNIFGCNYSNNECNEVSAGDFLEYGTNISTNGLRCEYVNDSNICNNIATLSTCCNWQNGTCYENRVTATCYNAIDSAIGGGASSCEDATSQTSCEELAGTPLYWPCRWDNTTMPAKCAFNADNVWGNRTQNLVNIENQKTCEAAGGKWIIENYCEGNVSVPAGRCEYKFDEETNCNKACFACEFKSDSSNYSTSSEAELACLGSTLGYCDFEANTSAPNSLGYCKAKPQFKSGISEGCTATNCGGCTFMGDPNAVLSQTNGTKSPKEYCEQFPSSCKWITDNTTATNGYCTGIETKTCKDSCDRCITQENCQNLGRTSLTGGTTGSCKWQDGTSTCVANIGNDVEVCWNGEDDDNDGLIDCTDSSCFSDSFCGFVGGDCFIYTTNSTCSDANCEWVTDNWGGWCDYKGSQCWKYDRNSSVCEASANCKWESGSGSSGCERDWSIEEICTGLSITACEANSSNGCSWSNDTWCSGLGATTEWCTNFGGWCNHQDFQPRNCWQYAESSSACNNATGCSWKTDARSQAICEVNWTTSCWQHFTETTCTTGGCSWRNDTWGSWCENKANICWGLTSQAICEAETVTSCTWQSWGTGTGGNCQPSCFNSTVVSDPVACGQIEACYWKAEAGWCEEQEMTSCYNETNLNDQGTCEVTTGCRWKSSGWCSPSTGFSVAASTATGSVVTSSGGDCWRYDNNQSLCTNSSIINISCGWNPNLNPSCDVDWTTSCWQNTNSTDCLANGCWWNEGTGTGWCSNLMDQCWNNLSYQAWSSPTTWNESCNSNSLCAANSWGNCEPKCFSTTGIDACTAITGCRWNSGWCTPAGTNQMFDQMESGAPVPLGQDDSEDAEQESVDLLGFGMKDMVDSYGFGAFVRNFENASVCNKEKISSHVFQFASGMAGSSSGGAGIPGMPGGSASGSSFSDKIGTGNETIKYILYLDTDGSTNGNCYLDSNSSASGYEFKLLYESVWNATDNNVKETYNSYKCDNNAWKLSDIKISAWKKKMCNEIGGPMIAVQKAELARFPSLYDSTKDLRVAVATIGETGNLTNPSDTAGPGWATPGAIDFEIRSAFEFGADTAKFEDILSKGYVQYEDCFNTVDDDLDGNIDCIDWDCQYSPRCTGTGVNAPGYTDTRMPQVVGVKIEEYPDSALVMYDTNKPANGTLEFYSNDSTCTSRNSTVYDLGIISSNSRTFKLWHKADINNENLGYYLQNDTAYYYKLKVCDNSGKCAISKCSSFMTAPTTEKCGFCNFVARIKTASGWIVSYDTDQDETYEHVQGQVCGPNAGMKLNYTEGRLANIKLENSDSSIYFEFINASITKTGLNDKVRTISGASDIIGSSTLVGMTSETRDKIINNLHPEICRIKVPTTGSCTTLYHCDDSGSNCVDRTSEATLISSSGCVWQIPYCEFSTYKTTTSSGDGGGGGSGGGGGGGGGSAAGPSANITGESYTKAVPKINAGETAKFEYTTTFGITSIEVTVKNTIYSSTIRVTDKTENPGINLTPLSSSSEKVHRYLDITPSAALSNSMTKMRLKFKIPKTAIGKIYDPEKVTLKKYRTSLDTWDIIATQKMSEDNDNYYYEAESDSFSLYAIILTYKCKEDWACTEWDQCSIEGKQTRTCTDNNACGTTMDKLAEEQGCEYIPLEVAEETTTPAEAIEAIEAAQKQQQQQISEAEEEIEGIEKAKAAKEVKKELITKDWALRIMIIVLAAVAIIVVYYTFKKPKK